MTTERVTAEYLIETPWALEEAAEVLAGEQSSGTFVAVPGETEQLRRRFRARVEAVKPLEEVETPSLGGARVAKNSQGPLRYRRGKVTISWPLENIGTNLATLVSTIQGNLYELREFSGLRLLDIDLPEAFAEAYPGPKFSIAGTRDLTGVHDEPIIGTIIKPSVGLSPKDTAHLVKQLAQAGIDFIKDDELMANPPHSPLAERVEQVMRVINQHAERTGKKVMFAFNISDDCDSMLRHHDAIVSAGGTCVMVSLNSVGLTGVSHLQKHAELPIHGHRNGWGMLTRHPLLGMDFVAYQKLWRLVGVDHLHVCGLASKFWEPDDSVVRSIRACLEPMFGGYQAMPVISSGQWGGQAPETYRQTGSIDVMYLAGGGIMAHPGGPEGGVTAIRQAWKAAVEGIDLETYTQDHVELRQAIDKFGD